MNPNIAIAILLITFVLLIMIKCPITFSMIISTAFTMLYIQVPVMTLVPVSYTHLDVYKRQEHVRGGEPEKTDALVCRASKAENR